MITITGVIGFIAAFFGICVFVYLVLALANIFLKSYKPRNSINIIAVILILFIINGIFLSINLTSFLDKLKSSIDTIAPAQIQNTNF